MRASRSADGERLLREHRDALLGMEAERRSLLAALRESERERAALAETLARQGPQAAGSARIQAAGEEAADASAAGVPATDDHLKRAAKIAPVAPVRVLVADNPGSMAGAGEAFVLNRTELLLGRAIECDIRIGDGYVSRRHARLSCTPEAVEINDLDSVNGIIVNGHRVRTATLADGDVVEFGVHRYRLVERAPGA